MCFLEFNLMPRYSSRQPNMCCFENSVTQLFSKVPWLTFQCWVADMHTLSNYDTDSRIEGPISVWILAVMPELSVNLENFQKILYYKIDWSAWEKQIWNSWQPLALYVIQLWYCCCIQGYDEAETLYCGLHYVSMHCSVLTTIYDVLWYLETWKQWQYTAVQKTPPHRRNKPVCTYSVNNTVRLL